MTDFKVFVRESASVDALAASSIEVGEISSLAHKS
eukprot:CAMPEP_0184472332 /NCGR_PEP_ID=MMETSP0740-20130409/110404_1 /TAXON_ID=385413 /ORGANISM="Thalassiosira miniscula, Strain CCMP1093" /LENGTH=34 /DNA_ID= /DNA_START= /DNA_END= /DNA_ORIENTATION=